MNSSQSPKNSFEQLYGKPLTQQQVAEMNFNLSMFVESLAEMDKQQKASKHLATNTDNAKDSSEPTTEAIH
jgi:hypothetical protein